MLDDHAPNLQIDVLVNSLGPHEQVRIREPFCGLQRLGVDCKLHRFPFRLRRTIRPHSLVIWQRPRPESWEQQLNILRWVRARGSLLLTEWDDHPDLFPSNVQTELNLINMAPIRLCHTLHTSTQYLADALYNIQPQSVVIPNAVWRIPALNIEKHKRLKQIRIFIGNQNRQIEHMDLVSSLRNWCEKETSLRIIVVGDSNLARQLPDHQVERYPLLPYRNFRKVLSTCHIALMPLNETLGNRCKTPIKWMEAAAESVAVVASPCLYEDVIGRGETGLLATSAGEMTRISQELAYNTEKRIGIVARAYIAVTQKHDLRSQLKERLLCYQQLWSNRAKIDANLLVRHPEATTESSFPL